MSRRVPKPPHRIVLTGGSGTLGGHFLRACHSRPDIAILVLLRPGGHAVPPAGAVSTGGDVHFARPASFARQDLDPLVRAFRPTSFVHCAAGGMESPRPPLVDLLRLNVELPVELVGCTADNPGCHFVFVGSGLAYQPQGRPLRESDALGTTHPYGASKAAADILVRSVASERGVPLTVLRPFGFTGPGDDRQRLFPSLLRAAVTEGNVALSAGTQVRDHCSARDIAEGILLALDHAPEPDEPAQIYNLGSGRTDPLHDVVRGVVDELGLDVRLDFGALPFSRFEPMHLVADTTAVRTALGWQPRHNLAHAVWQLARATFPTVALREPAEFV